MPNHLKKSLKWFSIFLSLGIAWVLVGYLAAKYATMPQPAIINIPTSLQAYPHQDVSVITADQLRIKAWLIGHSDTTVIILSGIKANRLATVDRATFYLEQGFSVLLPDLRATGESEGDVISFGWHERHDLIACYEFLKSEGKTHIALHGSSLGAATITYALSVIKDSYFIVLESPYDQLRHAIQHRMEPFMLPEWLYSPMLWMGEWIAQIDIEELQPQTAITACKTPLLHLAGDQERQLPLHESKAIFANCPAHIKTFHVFEGGKHEDFFNKYTIEYIQVWKDFTKRLN
ncbi:MAG: alpha/beta hydrolase [Flammeovirgaceae bacterium]